LVLGCTHYPLLARTIGSVMGPETVLVSSAEETAFAVRAELSAAHPVAHAVTRSTARQVEFVTSGHVATFRHLGGRFLGPEVDEVEAWTWS
jgi:glutamate racemase